MPFIPFEIITTEYSTLKSDSLTNSRHTTDSLHICLSSSNLTGVEMTKLGFVSSFAGSSLFAESHRFTDQKTCRRGSNAGGLVMQEKPKKGLFGRLKDSLLKPLVTVPGGGTANSDLIECVFCKGSGICDCDACKGTGKDALGTCLMCDGKTHLTCTVCCGVGTVDRIRRGGTDDKKEFVVKKTKG